MSRILARRLLLKIVSRLLMSNLLVEYLLASHAPSERAAQTFLAVPSL